MLKIPALSKEKLLEAFSVAPETPLLLGQLAVSKGMEEIARENITVANLSPDETKYFAGYMDCARETQERVCDLVERARRMTK